MAFVRHAGAAAVLVILTLLFQSAGMAALIHWGRAHFARDLYRLGPLRSALLMVRFTSVIIALHILQILLWAAFYRWNCFPSWESAFYFSTASYSTVGYGDLVLPEMWRTFGPVESVTGVLMCGLSASFLFATMLRLVEREIRFSPELVRPTGERASPSAHSSSSRWTERWR
jgi:voltage-gated potassium channel